MPFSQKALVLAIVLFLLTTNNNFAQMTDLKLPKPELTEGKNLRQNIQERSSQRSLDSNKPLSLQQLSTILWATYGKKLADVDSITSASYVIPSAGAIYALEIFVLVGQDSVQGLSSGLYYYAKEEHSLKPISSQDNRKELANACLGQRFVLDAPVSIIIAAQYDKMARRYGDRAGRYTDFEAGHAAQNLYLIVNDLGLATVEVGAFRDEEVARVLGIEHPVLLIMPIGFRK